MSKKVPEVIFGGKSHGINLLWDNEEDFRKYLIEHDGERLFIHIEPEVQLSPKMKMYGFYYRVILNCALIGYTACGYEGLDKVKCDCLLKAEFLKDFVRKPNGEYQIIIMDKTDITSARLHKYLSDCIFFIETELQVLVPESETYKLNKLTGNNFKKVE